MKTSFPERNMQTSTIILKVLCRQPLHLLKLLILLLKISLLACLGNSFAIADISFKDVKDEVDRMWRKSKPLQINTMGNNMFLFEYVWWLCDAIIEKGSWRVKGYLLSLQWRVKVYLLSMQKYKNKIKLNEHKFVSQV